MIKIVASLTLNQNYEIANQAARAPYFLIFENDELIETVENPFTKGLGGGGGLGILVVEFLKEKNCKLFIAGKIGDKMKNALNENGIKYEIK